MTTTNHTALYRFTFPTAGDTSLSPLILADTIDLPLSRINATISVDGDTGRITGSGTFVPSFGLGTYDLHFCTDFKGAAIRDTGVGYPSSKFKLSKISDVSSRYSSTPEAAVSRKQYSPHQMAVTLARARIQ